MPNREQREQKRQIYAKKEAVPCPRTKPLSWAVLDLNGHDGSAEAASTYDSSGEKEGLRAATGAAIPTEIDPQDRELVFVMESWPNMPPNVRQDVLAILQNAMK